VKFDHQYCSFDSPFYYIGALKNQVQHF